MDMKRALKVANMVMTHNRQMRKPNEYMDWRFQMTDDMHAQAIYAQRRHEEELDELMESMTPKERHIFDGALVKLDELKEEEKQAFIENWGKVKEAGRVLPVLSTYLEQLHTKYVGSVAYAQFHTKTTVCVLHLYNGFEVVGSSASRKPEDFDAYLGKHYAFEDALKKLGAHVAFGEHEAEHKA